MKNDSQWHFDKVVSAMNQTGCKPLAKKMKAREDLSKKLNCEKVWHTTLTEKDASRYSTVVGTNWDHLFIHLDIPMTEIQQQKETSGNNIQSTITNLLIKWLKRKQAEATHGKLIKTLQVIEEDNQIEIDWPKVKKILNTI
ncbi:uncharacterized protein LOC131943291 [Physella acuta]|uniref:uncharacterized protein LOC131943291 n=1 Tax=Physella acuta TaxID=109671 RepID=UPI0027DC9D84|nr:uncharacterized protein LOC131943291 [Physella acuta]